MRQSLDSVSQLILGIYRAAEDPTLWARTLSEICAAVDGAGAAITHQDHAVSSRNVNAFAGFGNDTIALYEAHYFQLDPWGSRMRPEGWVPGRVFDGRELVDESTVRGSEWGSDFGSRFDCVHSLIGILEPLGDRVASLSINRGVARGGFGEAERRLLLALAPHLRQALRLHRRLTDAVGQQAVTGDALDRLPCGVILVDRHGSPIFVNRSARELVNPPDGLTIDGDRLRGATPQATQQIWTAIAQAVRLSRREAAAAAPSAFVLMRPSGRAPLRVVVVPAGPHLGPLGQEVSAAAALFVTDPETNAIDEPALVAQLFHLTATESRVAARLVNGETVAEMAATLGMSRETVRWHLKHILHKADARTQAQFVSRVLRSPAWLRRHRGV